MTDQTLSVAARAGRAVGHGLAWIAAVAGRSRAIMLTAILALPPGLAWVYGATNVTPERCSASGGRYAPCVLMSPAHLPYPYNWHDLLAGAFVVALMAGFALVMSPSSHSAKLCFQVVGAVICVVATIQLIVLMSYPNASALLLANGSWIVVPTIVGTAAGFAASRSSKR